MEKYNKDLEIKNLIKKGFDLEDIAFEFDIPIEKLKTLQKTVENEQNEISSKNDSIVNENKIESIQESLEKSNIENKEHKQRVDKEKRYVDLIIFGIEKIAERLDNEPQKKIKQIKKIIKELNKIENYNLTIEQTEKIYKMLQSKNLEEIDSEEVGSVRYTIEIERKNVLRKFAESVNAEVMQTDDILKLSDLERKVITKTNPRYQMILTPVRSKIENKILKINKNNALKKIKSDIPENIEKNMK